MQITSEILLEKGTPVRVGNKRGVVTYSKLVSVYNGGQIVLTTIRFKERFNRGFGKAGIGRKLISRFSKR